MRYAIVRAGIVVNVAVADAIDVIAVEDGEQVVIDDGHAVLGGAYADGVFLPLVAAPVAPAPVVTSMSKLTFLRRFTQPERIAIRAQIASDPVIADVNQLMELADIIDVADPDTANYVGYLAQQGLITPGRVPEILAPVEGDRQ